MQMAAIFSETTGIPENGEQIIHFRPLTYHPSRLVEPGLWAVRCVPTATKVLGPEDQVLVPSSREREPAKPLVLEVANQRLGQPVRLCEPAVVARRQVKLGQQPAVVGRIALKPPPT